MAAQRSPGAVAATGAALSALGCAVGLAVSLGAPAWIAWAVGLAVSLVATWQLTRWALDERAIRRDVERRRPEAPVRAEAAVQPAPQLTVAEYVAREDPPVPVPPGQQY